MLGTKWCGVGNQSESFNDLGIFASTDRCCREHDTCKDYILVGESKYGLANDGDFTWSLCDCDVKLFQCLKSARTLASKYLGYLYFTILGPKCFKVSLPIVQCVEYHYFEHMITGYVLLRIFLDTLEVLFYTLEQNADALNMNMRPTKKSCFNCLTIQFFERNSRSTSHIFIIYVNTIKFNYKMFLQK